MTKHLSCFLKCVLKNLKPKHIEKCHSMGFPFERISTLKIFRLFEERENRKALDGFSGDIRFHLKKWVHLPAKKGEFAETCGNEKRQSKTSWIMQSTAADFP